MVKCLVKFLILLLKDWIRRVYLEDNCEDEEKREFYCIK